MSVLREENAMLRSEVEEDRDVIIQLEEMTDRLRRQRAAHQASLLVRVLAGLPACLSVCLSVCLPACLSACLPVCLSVCLSVVCVRGVISQVE